MEETWCIWSTYPDWIPPDWESAASVTHELYALFQVAPPSHPSPADKSGWAWQMVINSLTPAPSLPAGPADNWVRHGKQSQTDPFSASKSCRQLGLTWKTGTSWPLLCQQVLQVVRSDMENVINWPLLCQQVLQIIGSDMENCDQWPLLCQSVISDMKNSHKLTPSLPASIADSQVWYGVQSHTDPFSARQSCLTWKMVTNWHLLCQ